MRVNLPPFRKHSIDTTRCSVGSAPPGILTTMWVLLEVRSRGQAASGSREVLSGNLCRCTGYIAIVEAVFEAATAIGAWP